MKPIRYDCFILDDFFMYRGLPFRTEFQNIGEARSIIPQSVNVIALTATASSHTRKVIQDSLCMYNCYAVVKVSNRHNIRYSVRRKPDDPRDALKAIISSLQEKGKDADRYIIFYRTYDDVVKVHECLADELGSQSDL